MQEKMTSINLINLRQEQKLKSSSRRRAPQMWPTCYGRGKVNCKSDELNFLSLIIFNIIIATTHR